MKQKLRITLPDDNHAERSYVTQQILGEWLGLDYETVWNKDAKDYRINVGEQTLIMADAFWIKHSEPGSYLAAEHIPSEIRISASETFRGVPIIYGEDRLERSEKHIFCGIDLWASIFFMLTRWEEFVLQREETGKCDEKLLLCVKAGMTDVPIVNIYIRLLIDWLRDLGAEVSDPDYDRIMLTHDVDWLYLTSLATLVRNLWRLAFRQKQVGKAARIFKNCMSYKVRGRNPFVPFGEMMDHSERYGLRDHFFFKVCEEGERGYTYTIRHKIAKRWIAEIIRRGHHIGLHPSESTFNDDRQFEAEVRRLQTAVGGYAMQGGRNHELYCNTHTFYQWQKAFAFDSGMGYQWSNGFRCGVCYPFRVFDLYKRQTLRLLEIPFVAMDTVAIRKGWSPEEALIQAIRIHDIVRHYKGVYCINWHTNQLNVVERSAYKSVYFKLLNHIGKRQDICHQE